MSQILTAAPSFVRREKLLAHGAMLLFAAVIGGAFTAGGLALPHIAPTPLNAMRFIMATAVMGVVAFGFKREPMHLPAAPWRLVILGGLTAAYFLSMFVALTMTAPVATSAVFTLIPLITAGFAFLILRQRTSPLVLASLLLAGLGSVWVIFRGDLAAIGSFDLRPGEVVYFLGCVCYALYSPLIRKFNRGDKALVFSFWTLAAATVWIVIYGAPEILATDWLHLPSVVWWVLIYLAVFPTALSFFCLQYAALRLPASKVLAYGYLTPAFVILFEGLAGHGWATLSVAAGVGVIVLGLVILAFTPDKA